MSSDKLAALQAKRSSDGQIVIGTQLIKRPAHPIEAPNIGKPNPPMNGLPAIEPLPNPPRGNPLPKLRKPGMNPDGNPVAAAAATGERRRVYAVIGKK